jgi:hypothetical protein
MRAKALASATGSAALLLCLVASASSAQGSRRAPLIRVYSQDGGGVVSNYVTPAIEVSEDAYVFAVMMDLDGRIQVLQPDAPGISVRLRSNKPLRLPNFFGGYNAPMQGGGRYTSSGLSYDNSGRTGDDTRGTVIALASRAPFNLELIEANGDWDVSEIRPLIEYRSPSAAAQALALYLGAKGEAIGRDYMRFAGQRQSYYAYDNYGYDNLAYCGYGYGGYGSLGGALSIANALHRTGNRRLAGYRPVVIGYDACGFPVIVAAQVLPGGGIRSPTPPRPRRPGDTTVFPKARIPVAMPRAPGHADAGPITVPVGVFPLRHSSEPQMREATMAAPDARRAQPRGVPEEFRPQPVSPALPDRRPPVERTAPVHSEPASGGMPVHRSEPRVIERAAPPPPPPRAEPAPARQPPPARTEPATPPPRKK